MDILVVAAVLPAIVLLVYIYKKDTVEKEPFGLIVRMFVLGMVAGPLAAIVESIIIEGFESFFDEGTLLLFLEYFIGVAAVEEGFKYLFLNTVRKNPAFNYVFDGIVYSTAVALGFAALENIFYVMDGGLEVAAMRALFSVPGHCADGVVMGIFFGLAKQLEVRGNRGRARVHYFLAFILPTIEHGFYDSFLSTDSELLGYVALIMQLAFIVFAMVLINRISKNDTPIYDMTPQESYPYVARTGNGPNPQYSQQPDIKPSYDIEQTHNNE